MVDLEFDKNTGINFPDDNVSEATKRDPKKFGLPLAKAIWNHHEKFGSEVFYRNSDQHYLNNQWALGLNDPSEFMAMFGINPKENNHDLWMKGIDFSVKNYATKRINVVVNLLSNVAYMPNFQAVDALALDMKREVKNKIKAYMENKEWLEKVGAKIGASFVPDGIDADNIPETNAELEVHMEMDYKTRDEMELEQGVEYYSKSNDMDTLMRMANWDFAVHGVGCLHTSVDANKKPKVELKNISEIIAPQSKYIDFRDAPYVGSIIRMTIPEFKKLFGKEYSESELKLICEKYATNQSENKSGRVDDHRRNFHETNNRIDILHFEYKSTNTMVHVEFNDENGNKRTLKKPFDYYRGERQQKKFNRKYSGQRKLVRRPYTTIYEGYWIVGSNVIAGYKEKKFIERPFGQLTNSVFSYKLFAPNMVNGRVTSIMQQMIPCLKELQRYHLKLQQIVAKAVPKGVGIDLFALRKAKLKWGNKDLSDQQKIEMYLRSGIYVFDSSDRYAPGSNYKPFMEMENGMARDIVNYTALIQNVLNEIDEITGINKVMAASSLHQETGKAVAEIQQQQSHNALEHLNYAGKKVYEKISLSLAVLHATSMIYSDPQKDDHSKIFGQSSVDYFKQNREILRRDIGVVAEPVPTQQEWNELYISLQEARKQGTILESDFMRIRRVTNLKQAQALLAVAEKKAQRQAQESKQADMQMNAQVQQQSLQMKSQADAALQKEKTNGEIVLEREKRKTLQLEHEFRMREIAYQKSLDAKNQTAKIVDQGAIDLQKQLVSSTE